MPPQMSAPVARYNAGGLLDGGKVDGGDFVVDAYTVSALGNGSSDAGAKILDEMLPAAPNTDGSYAGKVEADNGDGMSDDVSFRVSNGGDVSEARISQDEYIIDGNIIKELGNGDPEKGVEVAEGLRKEIRKQAYGTTEQPNQISAIETIRKFMKEA
jgi:hypothetical protein